MVKKKAIISVIAVLVLVNIFLSFYKSRKSYHRYYDTKLPSKFKKHTLTSLVSPDQKEIGYFFQEQIRKALKEQYKYDFEHIYYLNQDNPFFRTDNYCMNLLQKFVYCLAKENLKNVQISKCNQLLEKEIEQLEKCQIDFNFDFDITDYTQHFDNNIIYFNLTNFDNINDKFEEEEEFEKLDKIFELKESDLVIKNKNKNEKMLGLDDNKTKNDENMNKDCIEYGLSNDEILICTKYE
jgi:hypothetical protein